MTDLVAIFQKGKPSFWPGGVGVATPRPLFLDATIREEHDLRFVKTSHPIESAQQVTDHVQEMPRPLTMDVVVTNHTDTLIPNTQRNRVIQVQQQIEQLAQRRELLDVATSLRFYANMVFVQVRTPRTLETTNAIVITCVLEQMEIAIASLAQSLADIAQAGMLISQELGAVEAVPV